MSERYFSTAKTAELIGVSASTLQKWRKKGVGPTFKVWGQRVVRYAQSEIEAYMREGA